MKSFVHLFTWALILLLPVTAAVAQVTSGTEDNVSLAAAGTSAAVPATGAEEGVTLVWPNMPVTTIIDNYEKLSGKRTIRQVELQAAQPITINVSTRIPVSEALKLIEATLLLNNISLVPFDENTVKVVSMQTGKNPRGEGLRVYADVNDLPVGDSVVTFFLPLKFVSAQDALNVLNPSIAPSPATYMIAVPNAQAVVIQEKTTVIRQLVELAKLIDVPPSRMVTEFVQLERADCEKVVEQISKLIEARKAQNPQQNQPGVAQPPQQVETFLKENGIVTGDVQLVADVRTNRVLISTRPVNIEYFKNLVQRFDEAVTLSEPFERPLRYVKAADVLPVLQDLLTEGTTPGGPNAANTQNNNRQQNRPTSSSSSSGDSNGNRLGSLSEPDTNSAPQSVVVGKTRLVADNQSNAILVLGPPENIAKVKALLDRLDRKPPQVHIATVIGELTVGDNLDYSVDVLKQYRRQNGIGWSINSSGAAGSTISSAANNNVGTLRGAIANSSVASLAQGLNLYGALGTIVNTYVQALQATNRFQIISRPSVFTQNNKKATILSGSREPVPSSTLTSLNNGTTNAAVTANITYENIDLSLEVIPLINANKEISLEIYQTNNTLGATRNIGGTSAVSINKQELKTYLTVGNKSVIFLGGLVRDSDSKSQSGIPILSKIPIIGALFGGTSKSKSKSELVILLQPTVIDSDDDLLEVEKNEKERALVYAAAEKASQSPNRRTTITPRPPDGSRP